MKREKSGEIGSFNWWEGGDVQHTFSGYTHNGSCRYSPKCDLLTAETTQ